MDGKTKRPDTAEILSALKDFQRKSVDYVYNRLYKDSDRVNRFLIADEVGLGKTLVARGLIAKAVDELWEKVGRIDIIYICNNTDIARQNINRINIIPENGSALASRITLLPVHLNDFREQKINFVSFTPGTSFNLRSFSGIKRERALIYWMLRDGFGFGAKAAPRNIFQGDVKKKNWDEYLDRFKELNTIEQGIQKKFVDEFKKDKELVSCFGQLQEFFAYNKKHISENERGAQLGFIARVRRILSEVCISELEPDIIILDEFQKFKELLHGSDEMSTLAQKLFNYKNIENDCKIILLSATPYKMYTMYHETEDNHYKDFFNTIRFLSESETTTITIKNSILKYRDEMIAFRKGVTHSLDEARTAVQNGLKKIMLRTERMAVSNDNNGMICEVVDENGSLGIEDIHEYTFIDQINQIVQTNDIMEYWKSSPYLLNVMDKSAYIFKKKLMDNYLEVGEQSQSIRDAFSKNTRFLLNWNDIQKYKKIDPRNAKLRSLYSNTVEKNLCNLLWIPPSLLYYKSTQGPYAYSNNLNVSKSLIFSSWQVVPKVISQLCSYEAERSVMESTQKKYLYDEEVKKRRPLLNFSVSNGRLTGMANFSLIYPSLSLAELIDPMMISMQRNDVNSMLSFETMKLEAKDLIGKELEPLLAVYRKNTGRVSDKWYWLVMVLLDRHKHGDYYRRWFSSQQGNEIWSNMIKARSDDDSPHAFGEHIQELASYFEDNGSDPFLDLGPPPEDLLETVTSIAVSSPAVIILRSLLRYCNRSRINEYSTALLASAAYSAIGFRSLFNIHSSISLVKKYYPQEPYWNAVLDYCANGNLQSVMDEYTHILKDSLGLMGKTDSEIAWSMAEEISLAVSIRTVSFKFDSFTPDINEKKINIDSKSIRCRFALKFGDYRDDSGNETRSDQVRIAFNSPFQPFILATTSIGQEGLDFHHYCHNIYHWNLPTNPVDMEQREGRVHRFKGHAIRKNCACDVEHDTLKREVVHLGDVWECIFDIIKRKRSSNTNDLVPYWIYEPAGKDVRFQIYRYIPAIPMSREVNQLESLRKSLVAYRLVFGQSRQEDLVQYLQKQVDNQIINASELMKFRIDLSP